jgi:hypothetical protein
MGCMESKVEPPNYSQPLPPTMKQITILPSQNQSLPLTSAPPVLNYYSPQPTAPLATNYTIQYPQQYYTQQIFPQYYTQNINTRYTV